MKHLYNNRFRGKLTTLFVGIFVFFGSTLPLTVYAQDFWSDLSNRVFATLSALVLQVAQFLGQILIFISTFLVRVSIYSDFEKEQFVINGWTAVRDVANMFFIIVLLVIAVATILRIEQYSARRLMFKLLLMALLINFSKSIIGFIIEASQVVMLFFVAAYKGGVEGVILKDLLHMDKILDISRQDGITAFQYSDIFGVVVGSVLMFIVAIVTVGVVIVVLLFRIVALWILIIFSPLVFLLHAVPAGMKYASQWWGMFTKYVITGPILAFFLWIAFSAVGTNTTNTLLEKASEDALQLRPVGSAGVGTGTANSTGEALADSVTSIGGSVSEFFGTENLFAFMVGIALLIGALMATSQLGVAGASIATKAVGQLQTRGAAAGKGLGRLGRFAAESRLTGNIPSRARSRGAQLRNLLNRGNLTRLVTPEGRETSKLEREKRIAETHAESAKGTPRGAAAAARAGRVEAQYEESRKKILKEQGVLENMTSRRTGLAAATNAVDRKVIMREMIQEEDPDVQDIMNSSYPISEDKKIQASLSQQFLKNRYELEQHQSKKDKTFVGRVKRDGDRFALKERRDSSDIVDKEYEKEIERKVNSQGREDTRKMLLKMGQDASKDADKTVPSDIIGTDAELDKLAALRPNHDQLPFNADNSSNALNTLALRIKALREHGSDEQKAKYLKRFESLYAQIRSNFREDPSKLPPNEGIHAEIPLVTKKTAGAIEGAGRARQKLRRIGDVTDNEKQAQELDAVLHDESSNNLRQLIGTLRQSFTDEQILSKDLDTAIKKFESSIQEIREEDYDAKEAPKKVTRLRREMRSIFNALPPGAVRELELDEPEVDDPETKRKKRAERGDRKKGEESKSQEIGDGDGDDRESEEESGSTESQTDGPQTRPEDY